MATIRAHTTIEQSRKLAEILPLESADMCYHFVEINKTPLCVPWERVHDDEKDNSLPCWSFASLLGVLPNGIVMNKDSQNGRYHFSSTHVGTYVTADNPIDACYEMILKLNKLNLL